MTKKLLYLILLLLFFADCGFSFMQHYSSPLDGDMAGGIVPALDVKPVLSSPLGFDAFLKHTDYPNPNRFFSHWIFKEYFSHAPLAFQRFVHPIDSIYWSCAAAKMLMQLSLILLLAYGIVGRWKLFHLDYIIAVVLVTPLFQTNGYEGSMGIIDHSITYSFFYALPAVFLLVYFVPLVSQFVHRKKTSNSVWIHFLWIPLAFVVCLSGPLNPAVVLILFSQVFVALFFHHYKWITDKQGLPKIQEAISMFPRAYWFYGLPVCVLAVYSLCLGLHNSISIESQMPLLKMYARLPFGVFQQFTQKIGFMVLFSMLLINYQFIRRKHRSEDGLRMMKVIKFVLLFVVIYILLLPLGGYRVYRPYILRFDTALPITLSLVFAYGLSTFFLLKHTSNIQKRWYIPLVVLVLFIYTNADKGKFERNKNERLALKQISESPLRHVPIQSDCLLLSWKRIVKPEDSDLNADLLLMWNVTKEKKLYFNQ